MENVQTMIREDGRRQIITGGLLVLVSIALFTAILFEDLVMNAIYLLVLLFASLGTGTSLLVTGYRDLKKSGHTGEALLPSGESETLNDRMPRRMYLGHRNLDALHSRLYDMKENVYVEMMERTPGSTPFSWFEQFVFFHSYRSALYDMEKSTGESLCSIEKKGGFTWKGYVKHPNGSYVAYTKEKKGKNGRKLYQYIDKDGVRWQAEGDPYIGHYSVKDKEETVWAVIKQGAIPREAPDAFENVQGYLVEWRKNEEIPYSLIAFLFLIHTRV